MQPFIGEVSILPYTYAPMDWADCNGQQVNIQQYNTLFAVIGILYGGDGQTYFNLPNLIGRIPMHQGQGPGLSPRTIAATNGAPTSTLSQSQMANHSHDLAVEREATESASPGGNYPGTFAVGGTGVGIYQTTTVSNPVTMNPLSLAASGSGLAHENRQPFLAMRFCIAMQGIFPSRN